MLSGIGALPYGFNLQAELTRTKNLVAQGVITAQQAYVTFDKLLNMAMDDPNAPTAIAQISQARAYVSTFDRAPVGQVLAQNRNIQASVQAELTRRRASGEDQAEIDAEQSYLRRMSAFDHLSRGRLPPDWGVSLPTLSGVPTWAKVLTGLGLTWLIVRNVRKIVRS